MCIFSIDYANWYLENEAVIRLTFTTSPGTGGWLDLRCNGLYHENSHNLSVEAVYTAPIGTWKMM